MKRIFVCTVFLFVISSLWGNEIFDFPVNDESRKLVESTFNQIATNPVMKAAFIQTKKISRINRSFQSSGTILFDSESGIAWLFNKPFQSTTVITDRYMIQTDSRGNRQQTGSEDNDLFARFSRTIQSIFIGDFEVIEKEYELYYKDRGSGIWTIALIPKDSTLRDVVDAFELSGSDYIDSFLIYEGSDDQVLYEFESLEFPNHLSADEQLVFQK